MSANGRGANKAGTRRPPTIPGSLSSTIGNTIQQSSLKRNGMPDSNTDLSFMNPVSGTPESQSRARLRAESGACPTPSDRGGRRRSHPSSGSDPLNPPASTAFRTISGWLRPPPAGSLPPRWAGRARVPTSARWPAKPPAGGEVLLRQVQFVPDLGRLALTFHARACFRRYASGSSSTRRRLPSCRRVTIRTRAGASSPRSTVVPRGSSRGFRSSSWIEFGEDLLEFRLRRIRSAGCLVDAAELDLLRFHVPVVDHPGTPSSFPPLATRIFRVLSSRNQVPASGESISDLQSMSSFSVRIPKTLGRTRLTR